MRGYKQNIPPYLVNEETDRTIFWLLVVIVLGVSMLITTHSLYDNNPFSTWTHDEVDLPGSTLLLLLVYIPISLFAIQMLRMVVLYAMGRDVWLSEFDRPADVVFDTFEIHPLVDVGRAVVIFIASLVGTGIINAIMQHTGKREDAYEYGMNLTITYFVICLAIPVTITILRKIREKRLRLLATYRELGGKDT